LDLSDIWFHGIERWGAAQADRYIDSITHRMNWLSQNPGAWIARTNISADMYCYHETAHTIFFKASEELLWVQRILHQRMDPSLHLTNRE